MKSDLLNIIKTCHLKETEHENLLFWFPGVPSWWPSAGPGTPRSLTATTATCLWLTSASWRSRTASTARTATRSSSLRPAPAATPRSWGWDAPPVRLYTSLPVYLFTWPPVYLSSCVPVQLFTCVQSQWWIHHLSLKDQCGQNLQLIKSLLSLTESYKLYFLINLVNFKVFLPLKTLKLGKSIRSP